MKVMVKRAWFWLVIASVLVWLVIIGVWFTRERGIGVEVQEKIDFSSQITDKFNTNRFGSVPIQVDSTSVEPFRGSFTCTAKSFSTDKLELSEGFYSIFTANCYYRDGNNREKYLKLPLVVTDGASVVIAGYKLQDHNPIFENATEKAWSNRLDNAGFIGVGHIFTPLLTKAKPSGGVYGTFQGLGAEAMARYYSDQDFENFSRTGDPRYLNGILWTSDVGLVNTLNGITPERLPNITPN
jgi:hypothetical protein